MQPLVAVVTGASAGIGRATVRELAARGFDVALLARGRAGLDAAAAEVEALGGRALAISTDVADAAAVEAAASQVERELGPIDVWINNAMTTVFGRFGDVDADEFTRATAVTYFGQVHGTRAALARMKPRDRGRIVNVGSALAFVGIPLQAAYCGAKFACRGFTESVRAELLDEGSKVTISLVHLPAMNTPQFAWCASKMPNEPMPVPPIYEPETAARVIVDVAIDGRRSRTVGVWNRALIAAAQALPAVVAHFAARTGVQSQQTDRPARPDRPNDMHRPVDDERDFGARGAFDMQAGGMRDPGFLRSLPATALAIARSGASAARERAAVAMRRRRGRTAVRSPRESLPTTDTTTRHPRGCAASDASSTRDPRSARGSSDSSRTSPRPRDVP
jgi:short-subunit dehydrogenase